MADLEERAVPKPRSEFNDDVISGAEFANVAVKVVAFHVCSRLTVLHQSRTFTATAAAAAGGEDNDDDDDDATQTLLGRLNIAHLILLRKVQFYRRMYFSRYYVVQNLFQSVLLHNSSSDPLLKSVFLRRETSRACWFRFSFFCVCFVFVCHRASYFVFL